MRIYFLTFVLAPLILTLTGCTKFCSRQDKAPPPPKEGAPDGEVGTEEKPAVTPNYAGITVNSTVKLEGGGGTGKKEVKSDSTVSVKYSEWVYNPAALGNKGPLIYTTKDEARLIKIGKGEVIKGFEQGLLGLKKGGKRQLIIPATEAYGSDGQPPRIPPNAMIMIDLEVVDLQ